MHMRKMRYLAIVGAFVAALAPAFAPGEDKPAFSGFLGDYSGFQESDRVKGAWVYTRPGLSITDLGKYNKVILDPVVVYGGSDDVFRDIEPAALQQAADDFHADLVKTLGSEYPVVTESGPDVLHVKVALTGSVPKDPEHSVFSYIPVALVFRAGKAAADAATDKKEIQVDVTAEMDFLDSVSNDRLMAAVDSRMAGKATVDKADPDYNAKTMDAAFKFWAKTVKDRLDEAHGRGQNDQFNNE